MAKIEAVPPIPGVEDFWTLAAFLGDQKAYRERLKRLEDLKAAIDIAIEKAGGAEQIDSLLIQARGDRQMAAETLAGAKRDATVLRQEAKAALDAATASIGQAQATLIQERQDFEAARREHEDDMRRRELEAVKTLKEGRDLMAEADRRLAEAQTIRNDYAERRRKLEASLAAAG